MIPNLQHDETDAAMPGQNEDIQRLTAELATARRDADEARAANRRKSEQIAAISHDIRTSMGAIFSTTELLLGSGLDAGQRKYARATLESSQNLMMTLNQILDLSKLEAGRLELEHIRFDPVAVVRSAAEAVGSRIEDKGLQWQLDVPEGSDLFLMGDPTRLRQILMNLIDNAIKFTAQGQISVRLLTERYGSSHELRFEVIDSGIGVDEAQMQALFAPYSQADSTVTRQFGGTGLGLSLVLKLSRLMGGDAGVMSAKGQGSTFWFTVRCPQAEPDGGDSREPAPMAQDRPDEPAGDHERPAHILVAEDNQINRMLITTYLDKFGHTFHTVDNGRDAAAAVRSGGFDLVLMDIHMPEMDGVEAARKIRAAEIEEAKGAHVPIIALTANAMQGDRDIYLAAGMDEYVSKPIDAAELFLKINALTGIEIKA